MMTHGPLLSKLMRPLQMRHRGEIGSKLVIQMVDFKQLGVLLFQASFQIQLEFSLATAKSELHSDWLRLFWKLFEAWLVAEENHLYVLGVYGLIFGIMLPAAVGSWWYRSIQYTGDSVLIKTTKMFEVRFYNYKGLKDIFPMGMSNFLFQYYLYKTPLMNRRRALMVFSGAFEFKRDNNKEIKERENDEVELPKLAKEVEEHERNISKPPTDQVKK